MKALIDWNLFVEFRQIKKETTNKINNLYIVLSEMKNNIAFIKNIIQLNPNNNFQDFLNKKRKRKRRRKNNKQ